MEILVHLDIIRQIHQLTLDFVVCISTKEKQLVFYMLLNS
jgi:hypothetical protein